MKYLYKVCKRCIMDTSDPKIIFDSNGVCEYCNNFDKNIKPNWQKLINEANKDEGKEEGRRR